MKTTANQRNLNTARRRSSLRMSPIAAACSTLLLATAVNAQQASLGAVTVTGFRHAIETSIETKRNADSIVESVSAEDIGKLPDVSIAESLARLPGVAGVRGQDGRVQTISIRGLPPQFATTLLNGREMVSSGDNRSVEYDQFPSELFSSAVVYKTPTASLVGQGLAGTVDMRTVSPLSFASRQLAVNVRGESNSNGEAIAGVASQYGKRFSASYIDQSADKTLGWALGFAHLDTPTQVRQSQMWDWSAPANDWGSNTVAGLPKATNGGNALMPMGMEVTASSKSNKRDGLMAVLEFKPNKDLHSQVDLYYSKFNAADQGFKFEISNWGLWNGPSTMPYLTNAKTTDIDRNTFVTSGTSNNSQTVLQSFNSSRTDEITSLGWNTSYNLNKNWKLTGDLSYSKDTRDEKYLETFAAPYANGQWVMGSYNFVADPVGTKLIQLSPGTGTSFAPSSLRLGDPMAWVGDDVGFSGNINLPHVTDTMKTLRLTAKRSLDGIFSEADFGFNYTQRDKSVEMNRYRLNIANPTTILVNNGGRYTSTIPNSAVLGLVNLDFAGLTGMPRLDVQNLVDSKVLVPQQVFWGKAGDDSTVHEKVSTAYAMAKIDTNIGIVPVSGNVGVQFVRTDQSSEGWVYLGDTKNPDPAKLYAVTGGTSYSDVLPSMNLRFDLPQQTVMRVAAGRQMARPNINDLRAGMSGPAVNIKPGPDYATWSGGGGGNPSLEPWRATAYDFSLEKYFGKRSYIAVAEYYKNLSSWVYNEKVLRDFTGFPNTSGVTPVSPFGFFTAPTNGLGGMVRGFEGTVSLDGSLFSKSLDGIGVIVNTTIATSSLYDKKGNEVIPEGLSGRSTNLTLYYEQNGFSARISERYRSPFTSTYRSVVFQDVTTKISSDNVVDLQLGYAFEQGYFKGLSLMFQVNNLTDSATQQMSTINGLGGNNPTPNKSQLVTKWVNHFGRQMLFGVNYKF
jgi:TonB-dependent receptor